MGAGKTTVGKLLAKQLGCAHQDLDDLIVTAAGQTIPEIFAASGNAGFRALEHTTLQQALAHDGILSTGGGTPIQDRNFALLQGQNIPVVLLDAKPATILARIGTDANRPLVQQLGEAGLVRLQSDRNPRYRELADLVIATDDLTPEMVAGQIARYLGER